MEMMLEHEPLILVLAANPLDSGQPVAVDLEVRRISEILDRAHRSRHIQVRHLPAPRFMDLQRALVNHRPTVVHFCGHGTRTGLLLHDRLERGTVVDSGILARLFKLSNTHVRCVFLNACYTAENAQTISEHIDYVVGIRGLGEDEACNELAEAFYFALGSGLSFGEAFEHARLAYENAPHSSLANPQLHIRPGALEYGLFIHAPSKDLATLSGSEVNQSSTETQSKKIHSRDTLGDIKSLSDRAPVKAVDSEQTGPATEFELEGESIVAQEGALRTSTGSQVNHQRVVTLYKGAFWKGAAIALSAISISAFLNLALSRWARDLSQDISTIAISPKYAKAEVEATPLEQVSSDELAEDSSIEVSPSSPMTPTNGLSVSVEQLPSPGKVIRLLVSASLGVSRGVLTLGEQMIHYRTDEGGQVRMSWGDIEHCTFVDNRSGFEVVGGKEIPPTGLGSSLWILIQRKGETSRRGYVTGPSQEEEYYSAAKLFNEKCKNTSLKWFTPPPRKTAIALQAPLHSISPPSNPTSKTEGSVFITHGSSAYIQDEKYRRSIIAGSELVNTRLMEKENRLWIGESPVGTDLFLTHIGSTSLVEDDPRHFFYVENFNSECYLLASATRPDQGGDLRSIRFTDHSLGALTIDIDDIKNIYVENNSGRLPLRVVMADGSEFLGAASFSSGFPSQPKYLYLLCMDFCLNLERAPGLRLRAIDKSAKPWFLPIDVSKVKEAFELHTEERVLSGRISSTSLIETTNAFIEEAYVESVLLLPSRIAAINIMRDPSGVPFSIIRTQGEHTITGDVPSGEFVGRSKFVAPLLRMHSAKIVASTP